MNEKIQMKESFREMISMSDKNMLTMITEETGEDLNLRMSTFEVDPHMPHFRITL
jgi:hypothetical protein